MTDGCFRQVEYAGVLRGAKAPELARAVHRLHAHDRVPGGHTAQHVCLSGHDQVRLPAGLLATTLPTVANPSLIDPADIAANRERWVQEWTDVVLH